MSLSSKIIESLEARRLLSFTANINFQPDGVEVPPGFRVDTGAAYGRRANGLTYGWDIDNRAHVRDRDILTDQARDTLNHMQKSGNRTWEIQVPNGNYRVEVTAGDPSFFDSAYRINVEGKLAVNAVPRSADRFVTGTVDVTVNDGRLTVTNASGASNNKISFLRISPIATKPEPEPQPDPRPAQWVKGANMPVALGEVALGIIGNKMYVVGDGSPKTLVYDFNTKSWADNLAQRPVPAKDQLAEVVDGKLFVFGGVRYISGQRVVYNNTQIYNPATNSWSQGAPMPFPAFASQTAVINGEIYLAGGVQSNNTTTNRTVKYNPTTNTWTELRAMPGVGRNSAPAGTDGRYLFVFGGRVGGDHPENGRTDILLYNPVSNRWVTGMTTNEPFATLPLGRGGIVKAPFVNGEFYLIGGEDLTQPLARVDAYNLNTNTFRRLPDMITPRHGIYPVFSNAAIHVPGGGVVAGASNSSIFESLEI